MSPLLLPLAFLLATTAAPGPAGSDQAAPAHDGHKMDCPMHDASATDADRARHLDEMFEKLDADGNGSVDRDEFAKHHEEMRRKHAEGDAKDEHAEHAH